MGTQRESGSRNPVVLENNDLHYVQEFTLFRRIMPRKNWVFLQMENIIQCYILFIIMSTTKKKQYTIMSRVHDKWFYSIFLYSAQGHLMVVCFLTLKWYFVMIRYFIVSCRASFENNCFFWNNIIAMILITSLIYRIKSIHFKYFK